VGGGRDGRDGREGRDEKPKRREKIVERKDKAKRK
jgi:hypothetical protein